MPTWNNELAKLREDFFVAANEFEVDLKKMHKEELRQAKRKGSKEGRMRSQSSTQDGFTATEKQLFHDYSTQLAELNLDLENYLHRVKKEYVQVVQEDLEEHAKVDIKNEITTLDKEKIKELEALESKYHADMSNLSEDPGLVTLEQDYDDLQDEYDEKCDELGRKDTNASWVLKSTPYFLIILAFGLVEIAATYGAFLHFEEPPVTTWIWAIGFGLGIGIFSHFNGLFAAKGRENKNYWFIAIAMCLITCVVIYFVSKFRGVHYEDSALRHISLPVFICISLFLYLAGTVFSYVTHDSNPEFLRLLKKIRTHKIKMDHLRAEVFKKKTTLKEVFHSDQKKINEKFDIEKDEVLDHETKLRHFLHEAISLHDEIVVSLRNLETLVNSKFQEAVSTYRSEYLNTPNNTNQINSTNMLQLNFKYSDYPELSKEKNKGLWHYNPN